MGENEKMPLLEEVFAQINKNLLINIEVKVPPVTEIK